VILRNARVLNSSFCFEPLDIEINGGIIEALSQCKCIARSDKESLDLANLTVVPGLVDIHLHGAKGSDTMDATPEALSTISRYLIENGITSFLAGTMTYEHEGIISAIENARNYAENQTEGATLLGINLEGPYISEKACGAQRPERCKAPDLNEFSEFKKISGDKIKLVTVAPEYENAADFIKDCGVKVSLGHTKASYEEAMTAYKAGAADATHLFNCMTPFAHREPGVVGAVFDSSAFAEIICDGIHVNPAVIRTAFKILKDRIILISDSMRAAGLEDGIHNLGGQDMIVSNGVARTPGGALAGSTTNVYTCVKNAISFGISPEEAFKAATYTPARLIGEDKRIGSIEAGKIADLLVLDSDYNIVKIIKKGMPI